MKTSKVGWVAVGAHGQHGAASPILLCNAVLSATAQWIMDRVAPTGESHLLKCGKAKDK